jgi:hypothetical protein
MTPDCAGPLHVREDEEPDVHRIDYRAAGRVCRNCGHDTHETVDCPNRPS